MGVLLAWEKCPGLTCVINIIKPRFLYKTVDLWSYMMPLDRYSHILKYSQVDDSVKIRAYVSIYR